MTRAEHLEWAKKRAHEELERSGINDAVASMISDLGKHEETARSVMIGAMVSMSVYDTESCKRFIDGFN